MVFRRVTTRRLPPASPPPTPLPPLVRVSLVSSFVHSSLLSLSLSLSLSLFFPGFHEHVPFSRSSAGFRWAPSAVEQKRAEFAGGIFDRLAQGCILARLHAACCRDCCRVTCKIPQITVRGRFILSLALSRGISRSLSIAASDYSVAMVRCRVRRRKCSIEWWNRTGECGNARVSGLTSRIVSCWNTSAIWNAITMDKYKLHME